LGYNTVGKPEGKDQEDLNTIRRIMLKIIVREIGLDGLIWLRIRTSGRPF
jgi:hypothetical protein